MLDFPVMNRDKDDKCNPTVRLIRPALTFDAAGLAVTFVPDYNRSGNTSDQPMTYHHLRNELHKLALSSNIHIDTCYAAATAHIAIARFVKEPFGLASPKDSTAKGAKILKLVEKINDELERTVWPDLFWNLAEEQGLELQMGYLKFGRERELATMTGQKLKNL